MQTTRTVGADELLCAALDIGEHLLKNGGEIHRVEDTVERIGKAFGAEHVEVFTLTSVIFASIRMPDGTFSEQMRRVSRTVNNMYMVEAMNDLSRRLCAGTLELSDLRAQIVKAKATKPYPVVLLFVAAFLLGSSSALFFGGNMFDALCAGIASVAVLAVDRLTPSYVNPMVMTLICAFVGGTCGLFLTSVGVGQHAAPILAGTVMMLIPGLALGNSFRDMLTGDVLSGMMRLFRSVLTALMIALGFAASMLIFEASDGAIIQPWWIKMLACFVTTTAACVMYGVRLRHVPATWFAAWIALGVYLLTASFGEFAANALATLAVTLYCEVAARVEKAPVISFLTVSIFCLAPGAALYYTVLKYWMQQPDAGAAYLTATLQICIGIAAGIIVGSLTAEGLRQAKRKLFPSR